MTSGWAKDWMAPVGVGLIVFLSSAFFWHARDWNSASRLMLTYALVDRGTVRIDGLENQTGDRARLGGHFYTDKLPGFSLLGVVPYLLAKSLLGLPDHPRDVPAFTHWPADYWVTLGTSGFASATTAAILTWFAMRLGCGPRRAALVGLAYGLATPAYVYGTLAYGHPWTALALLASFALIWSAFRGSTRPGLMAGIAGFLAALAATIELQVGPVSALLGLYLLVLVLSRRLPPRSVLAFGLGALVPTLVLLGYNAVAFGSPLDMGYFHEDLKQFSRVHNADNPLGLRPPDWSKAGPLLWGGYRGLFFYAPIVLLAVPGWFVLAFRKCWHVLAVSLLACLVVFLVNLSYPEWTGGWSTGPRLLLPLLPFAMLPVAALLARGGRAVTAFAALVAMWGGTLMLLFQGVGGRIPADIRDPLRRVVWPLWLGERLPYWREGVRFDRTLVSVFWPGWVKSLPPADQWLQFIPLAVAQAVLIVGLMLLLGRRRHELGKTDDAA